MAKGEPLSARQVPEVRFWACFVVVFTLLAHALFPVQALALLPGQNNFALCNSDPDAIVALGETPSDTKSHVSGLKCADCVIAAMTGLPQPKIDNLPVIYPQPSGTGLPSRFPTPIKARAPPRPHSCGPPSQIQA